MVLELPERRSDTAEFGPTEITTLSRWTERDLVPGTRVSGV
jgi:hypothetical protein